MAKRKLEDAPTEARENLLAEGRRVPWRQRDTQRRSPRYLDLCERMDEACFQTTAQQLKHIREVLDEGAEERAQARIAKRQRRRERDARARLKVPVTQPLTDTR